MCGRFTQYMTWREMVERYRLTGAPLNLEPRYNIAPTTQILTIRADANGRYLSRIRWGLIPSWWKPENKLPATFNARADSVASKPMFRAAFKSRRCIIPSSGFFEWKMVDGKKQPYYITARDGGPLSFAGLWEAREESGEELLSCTIITTDANEVMAPIHNRMPVILGQYDLSSWLDGSSGVEVLKPCGAELIEARPVTTYVNSVKNQGERCIEVIGRGKI